MAVAPEEHPGAHRRDCLPGLAADGRRRAPHARRDRILPGARIRGHAPPRRRVPLSTDLQPLRRARRPQVRRRTRPEQDRLARRALQSTHQPSRRDRPSLSHPAQPRERRHPPGVQAGEKRKGAFPMAPEGLRSHLTGSVPVSIAVHIVVLLVLVVIPLVNIVLPIPAMMMPTYVLTAALPPPPSVVPRAPATPAPSRPVEGAPTIARETIKPEEPLPPPV